MNLEVFFAADFMAHFKRDGCSSVSFSCPSPSDSEESSDSAVSSDISETSESSESSDVDTRSFILKKRKKSIIIL
ncbi:hypothetical protein XENTR_v10007191 [Xenopus tropicalis]|nr:hypothetical protein XENTR_v10007191 [Xenopus tropicalis]